RPMTAQKKVTSIAFDRRSRNRVSTRPPTKTNRTTLSASEPTSCRSKLVMASWSRLATRAASESATPNKRDQVRRLLKASSHSRCRRGRIAGDEAVGQFDHHLGALGSTHPGPASNLVGRSAAAKAQADAGVEGTNFDARCLDHCSSRSDHNLSGAEGNCAIVAMLQCPRRRHRITVCG